MENMTLGNQEEDMMGHGHMRAEPSAAALEAARKLIEVQYPSGLVCLHIGNQKIWLEEEPDIYAVHDALARALDAYAAAALTQEQRDVLCIWEYGRKGDPRVTIYEESVHIHSMRDQTGMKFRGPDWLHAAATWVREQGAEGER